MAAWAASTRLRPILLTLMPALPCYEMIRSAGSRPGNPRYYYDIPRLTVILAAHNAYSGCSGCATCAAISSTSEGGACGLASAGRAPCGKTGTHSKKLRPGGRMVVGLAEPRSPRRGRGQPPLLPSARRVNRQETSVYRA